MIIFVHFYFPFSVHCYIIIYSPLCNESMDIAEDRRMMYTDNKSDSKDKISKMIMVHKDCMKIQNYKERLA